jgi:Ca2+-binding EF-hand superfamily protein
MKSILALLSLSTFADAVTRTHGAFGHERQRARASFDKVLRSGSLRGNPEAPPGVMKDTDNLANEVKDQAVKSPASRHFQAVDVNGDGRILLWEYLKATKADENIAQARFKCMDTNLDGAVDAEEFAHAQGSPADLEKCTDNMFAYRMLDANQDGHLSQKEMWRNVGDLSYGQRWAFMIACSDKNQDGKVSPSEFSKDIYGCTEDGIAEADARFSKFEKSDTDKSGCVDKAELGAALKLVLGYDRIKKSRDIRGDSANTLGKHWMLCADKDLDECLNEKEYATLMDPSQEQGACMGWSFEKYEFDMDFEIMDKSHDGRVSRQEYYDWIQAIELEVDHQEAEAIWKDADTNKDDFVDRAEYDSAGAKHEGDGPSVFFHAAIPHRHRQSHSLVFHSKA